MKKCRNCQQEVSSDSKFCLNCGEKLSTVDDEQSCSQEVEQALTPVEPEPALPMSDPEVKQVYSLNKKVVGVLIGLIAITAVLFAVITWKPSNEKIQFQNEQKLAQAGETLPAPETIHMVDDSYVLYLNRTEQLSFYTYPEKADTSELKWDSSTDTIKINQSGFIYSAEPNAEGIITVSNADGSVKAESHVRVSTKDEAFYAVLDHINQSQEDGYEQLDYTRASFQVENQRDEDYIKAVNDFTEINEEIEGYRLKQKQFKNVQTNNVVDVDIYSDHGSGDIRKIVAIEYLPDSSLAITDFYFMNGQARFIFNRNENYYRPVSAKQDFVGDRYYYYNDTMLLWRNIEQPSDKFNKTDYKFEKGEFDWITFEYSDIEDDDVNNEKSTYVKPEDDTTYKDEQYNLFIQHEQRMLNTAYNLYKQVTASPDTIELTGYVLHPEMGSMEDVTVKVFSEQYELLVGEAKVNEEGMYSVQIPMHYGDYSLYVNESGYVDTMIHGIDSNQNVSSMMQETVYLYERSNDMYTVYVNLIDAISGTSFDADDNSYVDLMVRPGAARGSECRDRPRRGLLRRR